MGSRDSEAGRRSDEGPVHKVCIKAFDLGQYNVTQGEWPRVMVFLNPNPSYFKGDDRLPVERVSWDDAQSFIGVMSFFGHGHYRLQSESEWEYAARAGTRTSRYWGDNIDDGCPYENIADLSLKKVAPGNVVANCDDGYAHTAPVGSLKTNPRQLYDTLGNVAEWVEDCYVDNYRDTPTDGRPNTEGPCSNRVLRGGSWSWLARAASRNHYSSDSRYSNIGFRVTQTITP
jgi:formylglycine-generating enzyme required for sulfatase activity